jgi:hypothetical protein
MTGMWTCSCLFGEVRVAVSVAILLQRILLQIQRLQEIGA